LVIPAYLWGAKAGFSAETFRRLNGTLIGTTAFHASAVVKILVGAAIIGASHRPAFVALIHRVSATRVVLFPLARHFLLLLSLLIIDLNYFTVWL